MVLLFGIARLVRPAPHEVVEPSDARICAIAGGDHRARSRGRRRNLVYLRDKALLFNEDRTGFVMYGVQGRTWVALGDPVGRRTTRCSGLIRLFLERCDDFGGVPVFYEVGTTHLHRYADFGLTFVKLGEEARVDLDAFTLEGPRGERATASRSAAWRRTAPRSHRRRAGGAGAHAELRAVSDDWLNDARRRREGLLARLLRRRLPRAISGGRSCGSRRRGRGVRQHLGRGRSGELSVDLMRFDQRRPEGRDGGAVRQSDAVGQGAGLPMVRARHGAAVRVRAVAGRLALEPARGVPLRHGESVYNFQGLRAYKEKFDPVWEPRYLAYPGGMRLPRILADVSALVAGGYRRIFL